MDLNIFFNKIWQNYSIDENIIYDINFGNLNLKIKKKKNKWLVFTEKSELNKYSLDQKNDESNNIKWQEFIIKSKNNFLLKPVMPDKAVVILPELPVVIMPHEKINYFVSIPVWLSLYVETASKNVLIKESEILSLSNTWFGDFTTGELAYELDCDMKEDFNNLEKNPCKAICPVTIKNDSPFPLEFQKLCLQSFYTRIYIGDSSLWTNQISVNYKGEDQSSQIIFSTHIPKYENNIKLLNDSRVPVIKSLIKKSFSILKTFTNY